MRLSYAMIAALALLATPALAGGAKSYQVTGPVLSVNDSVITVQKGKEKWEINADSATTKDLKAGDKVTVEYSMTATKITAKAAPADKKSEKKK